MLAKYSWYMSYNAKLNILRKKTIDTCEFIHQNTIRYSIKLIMVHVIYPIQLHWFVEIHYGGVHNTSRASPLYIMHSSIVYRVHNISLPNQCYCIGWKLLIVWPPDWRPRGCAECSLEPISTKDLLKWAVNGEQNGGIGKKSTNYEKHSFKMVKILPNAGF